MSVLSRTRALALALPAVLGGLASASPACAAVDPSFGAGGQQVITLPGGWYAGGDAVRTSDDKIVVAGFESGYGLALAQLTPSGQRDASFGTNGLATFPISGGSGEAKGVTTDAAGSIYVAVNDYAGTHVHGQVWKVNGDGTPASGFGSGGVVDLGDNTTTGGIRLSPAGDRVYVSDALGQEVQVRAFSPANGALDTSFGGGDGIGSIDAGGYVNMNDLVVRPADGRILVTGSATATSFSGDTMIVGRFMSTGDADPGFGTGGLARPFLGSSAQASVGYDLFSLADGSAYVVGAGDVDTSGGGYLQQSFAIARLRSDGTNDPSFGSGGLATDYLPGSYRQLDGVSVQGDGGIVVTGSSHLQPGEPQTIVRRYLPSGAIDPSFADGGTFTRTSTYAASALVAQTSGGGRYVQMAFEDQPGVSNRSELVVTGLAPQLAGGSSGSPAPSGSSSGGSSPSAGTEAPVAQGCTRSIVVGPLEVRADCLKREGMTWTTSATATVGGLSFVPNGAGAQVVIDPLNLRIATKGNVKVQLQGSLYGRTLGPVTLYQGAFDWTFQYRPDLTGLARLVMPQPGAGGQAVSLGTLKGLPGLSGVGSLPKLDLGLPDFGKLSASDVGKLATKVPSLGTANVQLPLSLLGMQQLPELRFRLPAAAGAILGFPVQGDIGLKMAERGGVRGVDTSLNLALPAVFGGITGSSKLFVGVGGQVVVDALGVSASEVTLPGAIRVAPVKLSYDGPSDTWAGETKVFLGFQTSDTGLGGNWVVQGGKLRRIGISAAGVPLGGVATLDSLNANLTLDPTRVFGDVAVGFGPKIPVLNTRAVNVDGTFDFNGDYAKIGGNLDVANIPLASASAEYWWNGYFSAKGKVSYFLDSANEYGFTGTISGEASKSGFNAEGSVSFKAKGHGFEGKGLVSSKGIAGCAKLAGFLWHDINLGAGYKWNASYIDWIGGSCDFGPYRANLGRSRLDGGPLTAAIGKGERAASFKVLGDSAAGAPQFTLTGPGGETVTAPADGSTIADDHFVVIQQPAEHATYVAIASPKGGDWTFTPAAGTTLRSVSTSDALPPVHVTGRLSGGRLHYSVDQIKGQVVHLFERGAQVNAELGDAHGSTGSVALQPNAGPGGRRDLVAVVEQDGMVRATLTLAHYTAHPRRLPAPKVSVTRGKGGIAKVRWSKVAGATGYTVVVDLNGRKEQRTVDAKVRHVEIPGVLVASGIKATVTPLGGPAKTGKSGHGSVSTPKVKARKKPRPAKKK